MLRELCSHDKVENEWCQYLDDEDGPIHRYYAKTMGCHCCSDTIPLTTIALKDHIDSLKKALEQAEAALSEIEIHGETI